MFKKLITTAVLTFLPIWVVAQSEVIGAFQIPELGKFKSCKLETNCSSNLECTPKRRCEKNRNCQSKYNNVKTNCTKYIRLLGSKIKVVDPHCEVNLSAQRTNCLREQEIEYTKCEALLRSEELSCEIKKKQSIADCEKSASDDFSYCEAVKKEQVDESKKTADMFESVLSKTSDVKFQNVPQKVQEKLSGIFSPELIREIRIVNTRDFSTWYSLIYPREKYADWNEVVQIPSALRRDLRVSGIYIFTSPSMQLELIPIPWFIGSILQVQLFDQLGIDGYAQIYVNDRDSILDYITASTALACTKIDCYSDKP